MNQKTEKHWDSQKHLSLGILSWHAVMMALWLTFASTIHAEVLTGKVVGISDGDTITVIDANKQSHKVRLAGIDAPEKAQAFGQASKKSLSDLIFNRTVDVHWDKRDRYQRILGKVLFNGQDICLEQVKRGMAWHYKQYEKDQSAQDRADYVSAEQYARQTKAGLWVDSAPVEPSQFRHTK